MSDNGTITLSLKQLTDLYDEIGEIDVVLDSLSGAQSAGKRAVLNRLVKAVESNVEAVLNKLDEQVFAGISDDDVFAGMFAGVLRGLEARYEKRQDEILASKSEEIKQATPELSEDQIKEYNDRRKDLVTKFKATKEIFKTFGMPGVEEVADPKRRTGAHGKRGPRAITQFTWSVDGARQNPQTDTLAGVASENGYENAKALRDAMKAAGLDLKEPGDRIEFELSNGKQLVGVKVDHSEDSDDDDDADDEVETEA